MEKWGEKWGQVHFLRKMNLTPFLDATRAGSVPSTPVASRHRLV